jgi:hypothetical protein
MDSSWANELAGREVEAVEQAEGCPCVISLSGGYFLQIESLWRLLSSSRLTRTSRDEGQLFGHASPVRAVAELAEALLGQRVSSVQVALGTADLALAFGNLTLQVISDSGGYEAWQVHGPEGTLAIGQGGGNVAVWG